MGLFDLDLQTLVQGGTSGLDELEIVVEQINDVIKDITLAEESFVPETFAFGALVSPGSFGRADSAPGLGEHYSRAHEVTWKTLRGVRDDLVEFRTACKAAMEAIKEADESAADHMRVVTDALGIVAAGGQGRRSTRAHREARQNQRTGTAATSDADGGSL